MRRLILQPPRTCNCFHLVLAKFCIFDTCNFCVSLRRLAKGNRMRWSKGPDMPFPMPGQLLAMCRKSSTFAAWFSSEIYRERDEERWGLIEEAYSSEQWAMSSEQWANAKALWLFDFLTLSLFANAKAKAFWLLVSLTLSLFVSSSRITKYCFSKTVLNGI